MERYRFLCRYLRKVKLISIYADCLYLCLYYVSAIQLVNKVVCVCYDSRLNTVTVLVLRTSDYANKNSDTALRQ